ncbi:MAG: isoprenylcysteine carboxylmethyltransferase family protein [Acidobacteria bacterium]|nr:isoprenylcysteine carboxylmethyltransferase family protein [Acidobacteriota bacterium]
MKVLAMIRTLVYMAAFVGLFLYLAKQVQWLDAALPLRFPVWVKPLGIVSIVLGGAIALVCGALFALRGQGTPAPFDPPRHFVAAGPYRWVRNPMYLGGLLALVGFGLARRSPAILLLAGIAACAVHLFVILFEERDLERRFGESYAEYQRQVDRWIPRRPHH